ncbi:thermosome subunit [Candidatus Woesearchaeota archaeon]|nr:MAG: thermosome subunit [Candidatus Woesearchaeota archaeon]
MATPYQDPSSYPFSEHTKRTQGREAQRMNIAAAKLVAETIRTTLGPKGMDKMLVDDEGSVIVTNDGLTILEEMQLEHPAARMLVEIAKTQEDEIGDGTTTAVVLAGELLKQAETLLEQDVHPTIITKGFRIANKKAQELLSGMAEHLGQNQDATLHAIALTAMTGKGAEASKEHLASIVVGAARAVMGSEKTSNPHATTTSRTLKECLNNIKIVSIPGGSVNESTLVQGIVLEKERVHPSMPNNIKDARIALLDIALEVPSMETNAKVSITSPENLQDFLSMEERHVQKLVNDISASGANVVLCQKGIDNLAQYFLAQQGILAVRRVPKTDMERVARATDATIVSSTKDLNKKTLGKAGMTREQSFGDHAFLFIEACTHPQAVTILIRGGTEHVTSEVRRAVQDSLGDVLAAHTSQQIVPGAGAIEVELYHHLLEFAKTLTGRERLAVEAFAKAILIIPRTLAENAGLDPIDTITTLTAAHTPPNKNKNAGINIETGTLIDARKHGIIEPLKIKTQALNSATEVTTLLLRIDDVIARGKKEDRPR